MKLKLRIFALMAMLLCFAFQANAQVAKIGETEYSTFGEALNAAGEMSGDVTVEVYSAVEFVDGMELDGSYTSIKFLGKDVNAKITIAQTAGGDYLTAHGKTVTFENLILAKANPAWSGNSAHMGNYFSIQGGAVTYTDCTFPNGACTSGGVATYVDCTFQNTSEYGLWVYDDAFVTVNGGTIDSKKGIKVYSEDESSVTSTLTVKNATFTENVTAKPAVAVGYAQNITLIGNTYNNSTAVVELDSGSDADCEGIVFVVEDSEGNDISSELTVVDRSNSGAACGVLVDDKIYITAAQAAAVATEGSNVTLLYSTTDAVEFAEGVNLTLANGVIADNVTVIVAGLEGEGTAASPFLINNVDDLVWFQKKVDELAADGSTQFAGKYFKLTADINLADINWNPIGSMSGDHGSFKGVFDGDNHTISNLNVEQGGNGIGLFARTAGNAVIKNLKLNNVTVKSTDNSNYVGGVVGNAYASTKIENVHLSGNIYISGRGYIGGIAGHGYVVMDNVSVVATGDGQGNDKGLVTSTFWCAGGILGYGGEGTTNIMNANVENVVVTSAAGGLGAIVGMAEDNNGTQPISGSNLSASNVEIKTYTGAYGDNYANYALGYLYGGNPTSKLTGEIKVENVGITTSNGVAPSVNDAVASIDGTIYFSLASAVVAADGKTITLLRDVELTETLTIPADKTIALDLNGKTISQTKEQTAGYQMILNDGNLTIDDSSESKAGKISYTDSGNGGGYISDVIYNRSVLVIKGGTIENLSSAIVASNGYPHAVDTYSGIRDTYVEINGGTIYCAEYSAIRMFCVSATNKADLVINGGTIKGAIDMQNGTKVAALGTLTINDGTFETTKNVNNIRFANWNGGATDYGISAEIKGGSFNGGITTQYVPAAANWNKGIISGGTYAQDMTDFCAEGFACEQNADGTYGIVEDEVVVAKVGDVEYTSLQEALNAAVAGTGNVTVTILENVDLTGVTWDPVTVSGPGYPVVTVEGNYMTITGLTDMLFAGTWAGGSGLIIKNLTIENSAIVNDKEDSEGTVGVGAFIGYPQASATITLENCHLKNSSVEGGHWTGGLIGMAGGYNGTDGPVFMNLTIKGCSVTGSTITGKGSAGGVIGHGSCAAWTNVVIEETTVSGNTITSTGSSTNKAGAVMGTIGAAGQPTTANGVTKTGGASVSATVANNDVKSGGTEITTIYGRQGSATGMLYVAGGSYDNYPIEQGVSYAAPIEGYEIVENADGTFGIQEAEVVVAKVGDVEYTSLQAAVDAATTGQTIILLADVELTETLTIPADKTVALDLNGKTVSMVYAENATANHTMIDNYGNLTIDSSVEGGKVSYTYTGASLGTTYAANTITSSPGSVLTVKGGTIENHTFDGGIIAYAIDGRTNGGQGDVTVNVEGGTITSERQAIRIFANSTTNTGALNISGGDITGRVIVQNANANANKAALNINGGTFNANDYKSDVLYVGGGNSATIDIDATVSGGTFNGEITDTNVTGFISGGTYSNDVNEYCAEGFACKQNADGTYGIQEAEVVVAKIGEVEYETLAAALAAAKDGETVTLLWAEGDPAIAMNGAVFGKNVTIAGTATVDWSKGWFYVGRGGEGNATVTFDGANLTSASANENSGLGIHVSGREKDTNNKYDGTLVIKNSTIALDYLINRGAIELGEGAVLTVKNGFGIAGRPASETENGEAATATVTLNNGSKLVVNNHNGMGLGQAATDPEGYGIMNVNAGATFETTQAFLVTTNGTMNVATGGAVNVNGTLTVNGTLVCAGNIAATIAAGDAANIEISGGVYTQNVAEWCIDGYAALPDLNGNYVVGEEPTATVNNLGAMTIPGGEYSIYDGSFKGTTAADPNMPLSFVMQFLADQDEDDMATSPYADWYGDFVLTFTGLESGSFSAEGCYLAGYYGSFGWVKVPVKGLLDTIEEGVRYPVMLGVGLGQNYDYICTGVKDFRCALYIPETVLEANPNIKVKLELSVVDNSKGQDAAAEALMNGTNIYEVGAYEYEAKDFNPGFLRAFTINDADALDYTQAEDKIIGTLTYNRTLIEGIWNPLYLPFSVSLKNLADNYEVAYYNTMHSYDNDNNGTFETFEMEVLKLTANELNDVMLKANYPYFIRPKNADACTLQIVETDATLFAAAEKVITTTSVSHTFQLKSTHKALDAAALTGCYAISIDGDWALTAGLKPHRLYLTISANDDSPYATTAAKTIRIVARGDEGFEGTTGVDIVETDNAADGTIYDLSGRPVEEPVKGGMYIINGKKVVY